MHAPFIYSVDHWPALIFTAWAYSRAVLGVVILSVCHTRGLWQLNDALQIFWYHMKGQSLSYSDAKSGLWATPPSLWNLRSKWHTPFKKRRLGPISAHNVWTVGDSKKVLLHIKSTTGFPTSHRWSAYVTPQCPKGWLKERFFVFYRASICEGGLGSRNSVCPSVTGVDCDKTKWRTADIFISHERAITLLLWYQAWLVGDAPFPLKSAFKVTHPLWKTPTSTDFRS